MLLGQQGIIASMTAGSAPGKTLFAAFNNNSTIGIAAGAFRIWGGGTGQVLATTSSSYAYLGIAGTVGDLQVPWISTNGTSGGSGINVTLSESTGTLLSLTIPSGSTAFPFEDFSTAPVASNRSIQWNVFNGASSGTIQMNSFAGTFIGGSEHAQWLGGNSISGISTASVSRYLTPVGSLTYRTVLAQAELRVGVAGTIRAWGVHVTTNSRGTATDVTLNVNGVAQSSLNVFAATTGIFSALPSITVVPGDLISVTITTGTGAGTILVGSLAMTTTHTGQVSDIWIQVPNSISAGATWYFPIITTSNASSGIYLSIAPNQLALRYNATLSTPQAYVITNTLTVDQVWTLMVNGIASAVTLTVPATTTGWITGTGSTDVISTDLLAWRVTRAAGSGASTLSYVGLQIEYTSG